MHRQWTKWLVGLTVMAVLLMVGLTALAANTQHQLSVAPQHKGQPSTGVKHAVGNAPALGTYNMSPAMKNIVDQLRAKGLKNLVNTPKAKFKAPAYKMFAEMAERAGVKVPESVKLHPESLCPTYSGWLAGPAMASNTNGTAMVWGGGQNLYFASNSDPTHPTVVPWGGYIMRKSDRSHVVL